MDVVPSAWNPSELFIYAVNHRRPSDGGAKGADSTVEIFKTTVGNTHMTHLRTVRDPVILTPNDVVGSPDGASFYFTNDRGSKTGLTRYMELLGYAGGSVGYCHVKKGCKFATQKVHGANGITRAPNNDTFYVSNSIFGGVTVFERQSDDALVKTHTIPTEHPLDNLSLDSDGVLWVSGFPDAIAVVKHMAEPSLQSPVSAFSIARNTGPGSFYGEKYKVTKVFEDDGKVASGSTSVVHDAQRRRLFLHGLASPHLTVCTL
ncbi:hypothetical protein B0H10DRAFT_2062606 [Mycena sp. CBHHK59/15]|nr:hypothetical protein B0H10DRAFT_2062606 [Mycena sp. CBHHK59/15]